MKCIDMLIRNEFQKLELDLTKNQFILLRLIEAEPQPQSALAMITERNKGSLARLIHSMESKGFVKRVQSKIDRRVNLVELTKDGEIVLQKARPIMKSVFDILQKGLDQKERQLAQNVLEKVMSNAESELQIYCPT